MRHCLLVLCLLLGHHCQAETVMICHGYDCAAETPVRFSAAQLENIRWVLTLASSPTVERALISQVVGRLYGWAGQQSLIHNDRGGNFADGGQPGRMDCIDHSTSTTRLLKMLERQGWLKWHRVLEPVGRAKLLVLFQHFSAVIEETSGQLEPQHYVVDSWFVNNGEPAVVMPLAEWEEGGGPDVE